ncbi:MULTISPECIES: hypothetical protein [Actinomadura]|uniref:Uncharacterized protein n=1 Tax=Actinomadura litoris TaxID=2678616 RepID=A0A7K1LBX4_9ACTN|nr:MULTISPECIES: hypothetical protein [Actinomadura]MBT2213741.1 hypothetical protein [Actinomadura sp. NEAU-AAG7]MUN41927.1 hypothetical protein [Actinomadura litoris]
MSRDEVDRALEHLRDEKQRIGTALLELEGHQGYQLLEGAAVEGETRRVQATVQSRMSAMWALFDLYTRALGAAEELRTRHSRPGQADLARLTWLLSGPSVELPAEEVPLERRTLLSVPTGERLTLEAAVKRMTPLYEEVARAVAALDTVWSALLSRLAEVEAERRAALSLRDALGAADPELDRLAADLAAAGATVRSDPMAMARDGRADTARLDALHAALGGARRRLEDAERLRAGFDERLRALGGLLDEVRAAEAAAAAHRDEVLAKIASPVLPDLPALSGGLDRRLAALGRGGDWSGLAARVADLERAARAALEEARRTAEVIRGLLDRREELRGRLEGYRVKAARLGLAEDAALAEMYEHARRLLWSSPCDLRKATVTLSDYQQAITTRTKGAER